MPLVISTYVPSAPAGGGVGGWAGPADETLAGAHSGDSEESKCGFGSGPERVKVRERRAALKTANENLNGKAFYAPGEPFRSLCVE